MPQLQLLPGAISEILATASEAGVLTVGDRLELLSSLSICGDRTLVRSTCCYKNLSPQPPLPTLSPLLTFTK